MQTLAQLGPGLSATVRLDMTVEATAARQIAQARQQKAWCRKVVLVLVLHFAIDKQIAGGFLLCR